MKDITLEDIENALKKLLDEKPELDTRMTIHKTGRTNDNGEPLYLVNIGGNACPAYIGGTMRQLAERIRIFNKQMINSIYERFGEDDSMVGAD